MPHAVYLVILLFAVCTSDVVMVTAGCQQDQLGRQEQDREGC